MKSDAVESQKETIFQRLMDWYAHNQVERKKFMADLLKCIRLNHIPSKFLIENVDAACGEFNCPELVTEEYKKRVLNPPVDIWGHRVQQLYSVFADYDSVRLERYDVALNCFKPCAELKVDSRNEYEMVLYENKLIIFGGFDNNDTLLRSVSKFDVFSG